MKRALVVIGMAALMVACGETSDKKIDSTDVRNPNTASAEGNDEATTSIKFEEEVYDFGSITQGEKVTKSFTFTNDGDADLVIVSAKGSCGCTVPEWPKEPIAVGQTGEINVVFNSDGKKGIQNKKVTIVANTNPSTTTLALKGEVIAPEAEQPAAE